MFGRIESPVAKITLIHHRKKTLQVFYVDSGADLTLIPLSIGEILELNNPKPEEIVEIKGIGEKGIPIVLRKVVIQIGNINIDCRIGWALIEDVPLLLGREDFFKYFDIVFSRNRKTIFKK